jgi:hypothetical protein
MQYIIGSWYRKDELAKRSCIFHTSSGIATMFSGYLMAGVYNLGGRGGFKGWQWFVFPLSSLWGFADGGKAVYHRWSHFAAHCHRGLLRFA